MIEEAEALLALANQPQGADEDVSNMHPVLAYCRLKLMADTRADPALPIAIVLSSERPIRFASPPEPGRRLGSDATILRLASRERSSFRQRVEAGAVHQVPLSRAPQGRGAACEAARVHGKWDVFYCPINECNPSLQAALVCAVSRTAVASRSASTLHPLQRSAQQPGRSTSPQRCESPRQGVVFPDGRRVPLSDAP